MLCSKITAKKIICSLLIVSMYMIVIGTLDAQAATSPVIQAPIVCNLNSNGLTIVGNPESMQGATWTYTSTDDGVYYNFSGILMKPQGAGPFPGAIVSHGYTGLPAGMADVSREMRNWGIVVINPIYTHASNDTGNSPTGDYGASSANILRASKAWDILCGLGYVDMSRIAAHGHSAGAFVTTAVLDAYPSDFKVGSHTAGGTNGCKSTCGFSPIFPALSQRDNITAPYSLHHGDQDSTVPLSFDQNLYNEFQGYGLTSELRIYAGLTHSTVRANPNVLANIKQWYSTYGMFTPTVHPTDTQAPSVSITSPSSGSTVSGTINVSANASDNVGVAGVQFKLDGNNLGSEVTSPPFSVSWDTSAASNGSHIITAIARDAVGNSSTTAVTVRTYRRRVWVW